MEIVRTSIVNPSVADILLHTAVLAILACCAACFVGCIEGLVEYFNKYAYIEIALYG